MQPFDIKIWFIRHISVLFNQIQVTDEYGISTSSLSDIDAIHLSLVVCIVIEVIYS